MKRNRLKVIGIIGVAVIGIFSILSYMEVRTLEKELENLQGLYDMEESLDYDGIREIVAEENRKADCVIEDLDVKFLTFDAQKKEGPVKVSITPKKFDIDGSAFLRINDSKESIPMERKDNYYVCEVVIPANQELSKLTFYVQSGGEMTNTVISGDDMDFERSWNFTLLSHVVKEKVELDEIYPRITFREDLQIMVRKNMMTEKNPAAVYERDGQSVKELEMKENGEEGSWKAYMLDMDTLNSVKEENCDFYVEVPLNNGTTSRLYIVKEGDDLPSEHILDGNGKTIVKDDAMTYEEIAE